MNAAILDPPALEDDVEQQPDDSCDPAPQPDTFFRRIAAVKALCDLDGSKPKVYLASRYARRVELVGYSKLFEKAGFEVTSTWLRGPDQPGPDGRPLGTFGESACDQTTPSMWAVRIRIHCAQRDLDDIDRAHILVCFTEPVTSERTSGGRHVEFGIALQSGKPIYAVGPRENIFYNLPAVNGYSEVEQVLRSLEQEFN